MLQLWLENGNYLLGQKQLELLVAAESTGPHQDHKKTLSSTERYRDRSCSKKSNQSLMLWAPLTTHTLSVHPPPPPFHTQLLH